MTTYLEDESGIESSAPREGIEIVTTAATYRIATGGRDVVIGGQVFTASPGSRGDVGVAVIASPASMVVTLPVSHALVQRYLLYGVPPQRIVVTIWRMQRTSGEAERAWTGYLTSIGIEKNVARLLIPSRSSEALRRKLPVITSGRNCPHILYDRRCRSGFLEVVTFVQSIFGRTVTPIHIGGSPDGWATYGELIHFATGERMTIQDHVGTVLTVQTPFAGMVIGDVITVRAGCDRTINTCRDKFMNVVNFGGFPNAPTINPFTPGPGYGIVVQS